MAFDPTGLVRDFGDIEGEARACRTDCALFDFSFMARAQVHGPGALRAVEALQPRPMADLSAGRIRYALRLDASGAVAADLTVWRFGEDAFEVMSGRRDDVLALATLSSGDTRVDDLSDTGAVLAVQGPGTLEALSGLVDIDVLAAVPYFGFAEIPVAGVPCVVGRIGYTGEKGFEIVAPIGAKAALWQALGRRARPAGFAAADILRIEAGLMLFANECRVSPLPDELGLGMFAGGKTNGIARMKLVCFRAVQPERPVLWRPRANLQIPTRPGDIAITSACRSVVFDDTIGFGYVVPACAEIGTEVQDLAREFAEVRLARLPVYDPGKERPRGGWSRHGGQP